MLMELAELAAVFGALSGDALTGLIIYLIYEFFIFIIGLIALYYAGKYLLNWMKDNM